ncbi:MAG TPA: sugar transferase [Bellilinea sp.]|nr:sugar transferase [Bellilinea sp.]
MNQPSKKVTVIVPVYNSKAYVVRCLTALQNQNYPRDDYEVIVVDDGSSDDTVAYVRSFEGIQCLPISHGGPSVARNAGAKAAKGEILAFTDSDCAPLPGWLSEITAPFVDPQVIGTKGVYCSNQTEAAAKFVQLEYQYKYERMARLESIDFIDTYSAAYRKDIFLENGGFDETFTLPSVEDQEFSFRLSQKGYLMKFAPGAVVEHKHDRTLGEYWHRKFGIGYWKAYMLRWLPQKVFRDSHTSPSQRIQILLIALSLLTALLGFAWKPFWWVSLVSLALFFITGFPFWAYVGVKDPGLILAFPVFLVARALALGSGLVRGLLLPPRKVAQPFQLKMGTYLVKRFIDILGSFVGLVISLPFILISALAIKLDSPGPVFFKQDRAGENGKPFRIWKLRTMDADAEERVHEVLDQNPLDGPAYKIPNDPRVTRVGKILRRWSIDELPQFWNVFKGDMSLVGPRPEEIWVVEKYTDDQRKRLAFKPGLTGPMQVNGRGELDFDDRLAYELDYMHNYTVMTDVRIILQTLGIVVSGKGAS